MPQSSRGALRHDLLIGPVGFWSAWPSTVMCRDRFVCVADPANPRLRNGRLSLADLRVLPHAAVHFLEGEQDPAGTAMERLGITPTIALTTTGWLPLLFTIAGTDMVAIVPERLARQVSEAAGVTIAEPPFGDVEIAEAAWWHPARATDPALAWLRTILGELATSLASAEIQPGHGHHDHVPERSAESLPGA
jgi:DNA-binding transcriptional LysR family regulator